MKALQADIKCEYCGKNARFVVAKRKTGKYIAVYECSDNHLTEVSMTDEDKIVQK